MPDLKRTLHHFARSARWTAFRLRLDEALQRGFSVLPAALVVAVAGLTLVKVVQPSSTTVRWLVAAAVVPAAVGLAFVVHAFARRRPRAEGALALDRHHALADRIATALAFDAIPPEQRTPLMWAAMEDAAEHCPALEPRRAAPFHLPREVPVVLGLSLALVAIGLVEVRHVREIPPERHFEPLLMPADDLELYDAYARQLSEQSDDPELGALARRLNQVVEDIAARRLDRKEAFERLADIERDLARGSEADREALEEGLKSLAKELEKSALSKQVADALDQKNLPDSEKAMQKLAERLKNKQNPPSRSELDKLREALEKASKTNSERQKRLEERRQELEEAEKRLLKKKKDQGQLSDKDKQDLEDHERKLKHLEREQDQAQRSQRQMSELDKQLAQAASDLMKEAGLSAKDLEQGAEDMNRMAQKELSDKQKEELKKKLQELRELMRQQGQGGKDRMARMLRFGQHARGRQGGGDQQGQGQGQQQPGQGKSGQGQGQGEGESMTLSIGPGSGGAPIPGMGATGSSGAAPGGSEPGGGKGKGDDPGGTGAGQPGREWGTGHDEHLTGDPSKLKGQTKDVAAVGVDTGKGAASSEVIYGAAQRGFVGRGYEKVYTDYKTVAERTIHRDEIPPGYRFYVQRYFQLIRPRD